MTQRGGFADPVRRPELFSGSEPKGLPSFLTTFSRDDFFLEGTGVKALNTKWSSLPSGLIVPERLAQPPAPLDQVLVYLTTKEIFGFTPPEYFAREELSRIPVVDVMLWSARILAVLRAPGAAQSEVDVRFADEFFSEPTRSRVKNLLREPGRSLIVPQAVFDVVRKSMHYSGDSLLPGVKRGNYLTALFVTADYLVAEREHELDVVITEVPGELGRELIANQVFNNAAEESHLFARFNRIWLQLSKEYASSKKVVDLEATYREATGVPLRDVISVALALWSSSVTDDPGKPLSHFIASSSWTAERVLAVLNLIGTTVPDFRAAVRKESVHAVGEWSFDTFGRYPVVVTNDRVAIVLDPDLLINRVFGWLPIFDIQSGLRDAGKGSLADKALGCVRYLTEVYVNEVLDSIAGSTSSARRVFFDADLFGAYGGAKKKGVRIADAAIDYGDAWVVIEVTTTQLKRESVKGETDEAIVADFEKLVGEVEQIDSTIRSLRSDEASLTGADAVAPRRYFPLLVLTEGFPVNPISLTLLREKVEKAGLLVDSDIMPLEVMDLAELELVESLQEHGGPSLRDILDRKRNASLWRCRVRDFIILEMKLNTSRGPLRSRKLFREAFNLMLANLFPDRPELPEETL